MLVSDPAPLIWRSDQTKHEIHPHRPLAPPSPSRQQWRRDPGEPTSQPARAGSPMACLAPQFMWAPSASSSSRCSALRVHCAVTTAVAVVDGDCANGGGAAHLRLTYAAAALQRNFESTLASEALLNEEVVVEAAAAEAVALARAASKAVHEVVQMVQNNNHQPVNRQKKGVDSYLANEILRAEIQVNTPDGYANDVLLEDLESYGIMAADGKLDDDAQYTENIAVKSARQSERRARRTRAAIKAAITVRASQKTATSSKKKRLKGSSASMNPSVTRTSLPLIQPQRQPLHHLQRNQDQ